MTWTTAASILGSLATIFGGVRWLLAVYFKKQSQLDAVRKHAFALETRMLKQEIDGLRNIIGSFQGDVKAFDVKMEEVLKSFSGNLETQNRIYSAMRDFVSSAKLRFEALEKERMLEKVQSGEVIGSMVPPAETPKQNVGKVIVKK